METGEVIYERVNASPRPPPKISLKHDWMKELGSEVAQRPLVGGESHQSLAHKGLRIFIFFMLWKDQREPTIKLCMGRQVDRTEDTIDGEPMEEEWNIFPGFTTLQLCNKVQELLSR